MTDIVAELKTLLAANPGWDKLLLDSITEAKAAALQAGMEKAKDWPDDLNGYYAYLKAAVQLIPRQDYPRETFNALAKFYWLLDPPPGKKLQESDSFNDWMHDFARQWGSFCDTPESAAGLDTFKADPAYNVWQYAEPKGGWQCFNDFFARAVKPGLRPIAGSRQDSIIVSPADCTFKSKGHITDDNQITFKHTHTYSIPQLLEGSPYRERFRGGLFAHSFLGPSDYHRFHAPVRGTVLECRPITGRVFLQVVIDDDGKFDAPDDVDNGYEFRQERGLIVFDTPSMGLVACLPIGMAQVSSVNMTAVEESYLDKGDEFGFFMFGGSDIILLFEKDSGVQFTAAPGIHTNVGMAVAEVFG
jgi:phosphatidylserine decarboxylase precursor